MKKRNFAIIGTLKDGYGQIEFVAFVFYLICCGKGEKYDSLKFTFSA